MRVVFRVDASFEIGTGHVMRCLTLAHALQPQATVEFVCREYAGNLCGSVEESGILTHRLPATIGADAARDVSETVSALNATCRSRPDWLIVDHYGIDAVWETAIRSYVGGILVIDDLANRRHECDFLLDQNYYDDAAERYSSWVPDGTQCLLGPRFALLRPEFSAAREAGPTEPPDERLFVSFGGYDQCRASVIAVEALRVLGRAAPHAEIVSGTSQALRDKLTSLVADVAGVEVHGNVKNIAQLMNRCAFALGAGGSSTWERCALGLPSLVLVAADNQRSMVRDLANFGAIIDLGEANLITARALANAISELRADRSRRESLRAASMALVDGHGTQRVVKELTGAKPCFA